MSSEAQKIAVERYQKTRRGKAALAKADRKRRDDPERKAYLAAKARERRAKLKAAKNPQHTETMAQPDDRGVSR